MSKIAEHETKNPITVREKLAIHFLMIIVQIIAPWKYSHQYDEFWNEVKKEIKL